MSGWTNIQFWLLAVVIGLAASRCGAADKPGIIGETHSWEDLVKQAPVTIDYAKKFGFGAGPGLTFKLGISQTSVKKYEAVVVYCLMEGAMKEDGRWSWRENDAGPEYGPRFGPFWIKMESHGQTRDVKGDMWFPGPDRPPVTPALYMQTIPMDEPGEHLIEIQELAEGANGAEPESMGSVRLFIPWHPRRSDDPHDESRESVGWRFIKRISTGLASMCSSLE